MFFLLPTPETRWILAYCLGYVREKFSIELHEFIFLSNHYHLVLTDPLGELPAFMRDFNSLVARTLNAAQGRWEALWSVEPYCAPALCEGEDIFDKCVYTLCNANEAGLVRYAKDYEGLCSWSWEYGRERRFRRPDHFFSDEMPDEVSVVLTRPAATRPELDDGGLRREIRRVVRSREMTNARRIRKEGGAFLGMKRVLRQRTTDSPSTRAPRKGMRPRVAGRTRWARVEAIQRNQKFEEDYRSARKRFSADERDVVFPYGTYKLRIEFGVPCEAPP
ncbi:MAG: hypothetical protein AAF799_13625 [Myxococcota bacterium]